MSRPARKRRPPSRRAGSSARRSRIGDRLRALRDPLSVVRVLLVAMTVITPSVFDLGAVKPFDLVKTVTVWFFGWLAFGVWLSAVARGRARARRFTMAYLAGAYLLVSTIATVFSATRWTSLFGWYGRHSGLAAIGVLVVIFYVIACVYRERPDRVHELIYGMAAGAVVLTSYIIIQRLNLDPIGWAQPSGATPGQPYFGTMGNANFAGGYLGLVSPWLYLAFRRARARWQRVAVVVWGVVQFAALWFTSARNGMFAVVAAVAMLLWIHRKRVPLVLKLGAAAAAAAALVLATIVVWHPGSERPPRMFRRVDVLRSETIRVRAYWWTAGMKMLADKPVFGWGPDSFVTENPKYLPRAAARLASAETADKPHNVFVGHAAETGILGLAAYLALLFVAFRRGFRRLRETQGDDHVVATTLLALLAAYVGQAFFSIDVSAIALAGWAILGLIAAVGDPPVSEVAGEARPRRRGLVVAATAVVGGMLLAALGTASLKADHESKTAKREEAADGFRDDVLAHHDRSSQWHPLEPIYHGQTGEYLEREAKKDESDRRELLERAVFHYKEMDRLQPGYHLWKMTIGKGVALLAASGGASFEEGQRWVEEAIRLAPHDWRGHSTLGDLRNLWAERSEDRERDEELLCAALDDYREASDLRPRASPPWFGIGKTLARLGHLDEAVEPLERAIKLKDASGQADEFLEQVEELQRADEPPPVVDCG